MSTLTRHDPLCPQHNLTEVTIYYLKVGCSCDLIARAQAAERRRIALRIREERDMFGPDSQVWRAYDFALQLVRDGGQTP